MFRGNFSQKIDEKGRVSVPAKFREVLDGTGNDHIFITNFKMEGVRCIDLYPYSKWLEMEEDLRNRKDLSPQALRFFQIYYFPGVQECQVDRQGRILVCPRLREYAALERDVVFTGVMDKVRIYSDERWSSVFESAESIAPDDADILTELGM